MNPCILMNDERMYFGEAQIETQLLVNDNLVHRVNDKALMETTFTVCALSLRFSEISQTELYEIVTNFYYCKEHSCWVLECLPYRGAQEQMSVRCFDITDVTGKRRCNIEPYCDRR